MGMHKRPKYPRKMTPVAGQPRTSKEDSPVEPCVPTRSETGSNPAVEEDVELEPLPTLQTLIARLRTQGYVPTHWVRHPKGDRAVLTGEGKRKVAVPSNYTRGRVCREHGNLVKVRHETFPDRDDRGIQILDVLPCPFCTQDPVRAILRSPVTR